MEGIERNTRLTRRNLLRLGVGTAATGALAAILSACGGSSATTAPATTAASAATKAPTTVAGGATTAATTASGGATAAATTASGGATTAAPTVGGGAPATGVPPAATLPAATPKVAKNASATKLTFWHALGGTNGEIVSNLTNQFNDSQSDIFVQDIFQGSYDDLVNKFRAGLQSKDGPHILQVYDIGQRFMIDSKAIEPMQTFIDADKFDLSQFEQPILNYYTVDKKLNAMPFNTSNPILYYNKDAFKAAGLDPAKAPRTWDDVAAAAEKLTKKDASGKAQPGAAFAIYGWFFEQWLATQNSVYADPDNGRGAQRATKVVYNSDAGVKVLDWWKGMVDKGFAANLGRSTGDVQNAFAAGQVAMITESTAALKGILTKAGGKFELGTGYMPRPTAGGEQGGIIMGGAAVYIAKDKADKEKQAAWKFVQFIAQAKQQGFFHIGTGYFPIRKDAYDLPEVKANTEKYPQFQTAIDQLHANPSNPATSGAVLGVFTQSRTTDVEGAIEETLLGKSTAKVALDKAAAASNKALDQYNASVK
ncbi:MAG: ABC transporter substrate-binding protein [Chloroflexota bacterium]|nr:ABC transporter substrate-binding protein [Chloroflexota bacterium]